MSYMINQDHIDSKRDLPDHRTLKLKNNVIHFYKDGQFGFWSFNFDKGQMPEHLKGHYTSYLDALAAAKLYLSQKNRLDEIISE